MQDPTQIELDGLNVRMRVLVLTKLADIHKYHVNPVQPSQELPRLLDKLLLSIDNDIRSLEERPVIQLMATLSNLSGQNLRGSTRRALNNLFVKLHTVVSQMASENADLVDSNFVLDYLFTTQNLFTNRRSRRDDPCTVDSFLDIFR